MKKATGRVRSKSEKVLFWIGIAVVVIVFFDTYGKELLNQMGIFRTIAKLVNPSELYYTYTLGILSICMIPVTVIYLTVVLVYKRKRQIPLKAPVIIGAAVLLYQIFVLVVALINNGVFG